jgi:dienelactone hydrolase
MLPGLAAAAASDGPGVASGPHAVLDRIARLTGPALFLSGDEDPTIPSADLDAIRSAAEHRQEVRHDNAFGIYFCAPEATATSCTCTSNGRAAAVPQDAQFRPEPKAGGVCEAEYQLNDGVPAYQPVA